MLRAEQRKPEALCACVQGTGLPPGGAAALLPTDVYLLPRSLSLQRHPATGPEVSCSLGEKNVRLIKTSPVNSESFYPEER